MDEDKISELIRADNWMMRVLAAAEELDLPDWWIGAGFLRNKIWDELEGIPSRPTRDVDLVYFDSTNNTPEADWQYDERMKKTYPFAEWEVRNQARMHYVDNFEPFTSTADGIAHWVETATCVAVKLKDGQLTYLFCYGMDDLLGIIVRPVPYFQTGNRLRAFRNRAEKKQWTKRWPSLVVVD
jgi:hypothetical protein